MLLLAGSLAVEKVCSAPVRPSERASSEPFGPRRSASLLTDLLTADVPPPWIELLGYHHGHLAPACLRCVAESARIGSRGRLRRRWPGVWAGLCLGGPPGARRATLRRAQINTTHTLRGP
jgi:hypothetical protein